MSTQLYQGILNSSKTGLRTKLNSVIMRKTTRFRVQSKTLSLMAKRLNNLAHSPQNRSHRLQKLSLSDLHLVGASHIKRIKNQEKEKIKESMSKLVEVTPAMVLGSQAQELSARIGRKPTSSCLCTRLINCQPPLSLTSSSLIRSIRAK